MSDKTIEKKVLIPLALVGNRLDQGLSKLLPEYSRSKITQWLKEKNIKVNGEVAKPNMKLKGGEVVQFQVLLIPHADDQPENIPLEIQYEDSELLILNKPVGMVVHPGAGNHNGTLVNALLHHHSALEILPRAGIVHRLDKDTSGLMVVAKTIGSYQYLVSAMQQRLIKRQYLALVFGVMNAQGTINKPIGRHPHNRTKMSIASNGRDSITHYKKIEELNNLTLLELTLETGRTHQIRVHLQSLSHGIVGDQTYKAPVKTKLYSEPLLDLLKGFPRQALHAFHLNVPHPTEDKHVEIYCSTPPDISELLASIKQLEQK